MAIGAIKAKIDELAKAGNWERINSLYPASGNPDYYAYAQKVKGEYDERAAREAEYAAANELEGKRGSGPQAISITERELIDRLKANGITEGDDMEKAIEAYEYSKDALNRNPDLTPQEIKENLIARNINKARVEKIAEYFPRVENFAKADIGIAPHTGSFSDSISRRNFLRANHVPQKVIDETEKDTASNARGNFTLPKVAKDFVEENYAKHARANIKKQNLTPEQIRLGVVEEHTADTLPESTPNRDMVELGKGGAELLFGSLGLGPHKFKGNKFAEKTADETHAENMIRQINPNLGSELQRKKELRDVTSRNFGKDAGQAAARPYMDKAGADFKKRHQELFGDIENEHEQSLINKMNKNYLEKIAPTIHQKYMTQGVKSHGHAKKERDEAYEAATEGTARAITESRARNRGISVGATLGEQQNQGNLASLSGHLSEKDAARDLAAVESLEKQNEAQNLDKLAHTQRIHAIGTNERAQKQKEINEDIRQSEKEHNFTENMGRTFLDAAHANPVSTGPQEEHLEIPKRTGMQSFAGSLAGLGQGLINGKEKTAKAGGRIRRAAGGTVSPLAHSKYVTPHAMIGYLQAKSSHQRLATGGQVDSNFMQDAVFAGELPSTALRQKIRQDVLGQAKEDYDAKSRNHLAVGGAVDMFANAKLERGAPPNPIAQGASMAKSFVESDRDREIKDKVHAERMKILNPEAEPEESMLKRGLRGFMAGAANTGNNDWLARTGKAYMGAENADSAAKEARRLRQKEQQKLLLDVGKQYSDERNAEKKMSLSEQAHELAKRKLAEDELTGQSTRGYHEAHSRLFDAQAGKLSEGYGLNGEHPDDMPTKPQTAKSQEHLDHIEGDITALQDAADANAHLRSTLNGVSGGSMTGSVAEMPLLGGEYTASLLSGSPVKKINAAKRASTSTIDKLNAVRNRFNEGKASGRTKLEAEVAFNSKAGLQYNEDENNEATDSNRTAIDRHFDALIRSNKNWGGSKSQLARIEDARVKALKKYEDAAKGTVSATNPGKQAATNNNAKEAARQKLASMGIHK